MQNDPVNRVDPLGLEVNDAIGSFWGSDCNSFTYATTHANCRTVPHPSFELERLSREFRDYWDLSGGGPWGSTLGLPGGIRLMPPGLNLLLPECSSPSSAFLQSCGVTSINGLPIYSFGERLPGSLPELVAERSFLDRFSDCFRSSFIDPLLATSGTLAAPIPKESLGYPTVGGASPVTNPISAADKGLGIPQLSGRLAKYARKFAGTSRVGGVLGRFNALLAQGLFIKDATKTFACSF